MKKPELLAPAGNLEAVKTALRFGADAVYIGGEMLQLRARSAGFSIDNIKKASQLVHSASKKLYVTVNALAFSKELDAVGNYALLLKNSGVDAAIISDLGVLDIIHNVCPELELHISTQASCQNYASALAYYRHGARRIVLAREMSIEDIRDMKKDLPSDLELEAFVHGAMCMAVSGRCILSSALLGRSANRGSCAQPCRWNYHLVEETRPNQYFPIEEDGSTAILSSRDLNCISFLDELQEAGVSSFKIEGRMKTEYYVAVVTNAYRHAIDHSAPIDLLSHELETISHRPYTTGFYYGELPKDHFNKGSYIQEYSFCGIVHSIDNNTAYIEQRNRFKVGDVLEIISPENLGQSIYVDSIINSHGNSVPDASLVQEIVGIPASPSLLPGDFLRIKCK